MTESASDFGNALAIEELTSRLLALENRDQCTADMPHDELVWSGSIYRCRCGMKYAKLPPGRLRVVEGEVV